MLINPKYPGFDLQLREVQDAASTIKRQINIVHASTEAEIDAADSTLAQQGSVALLVAQDPFFGGRREQLVALAARYKLPAIYYQNEYAKVGGLVSYETDFADGYRQAGIYVGRILKGEKPADLPVVQPTKFELVINLKTAKTLGLDVPRTFSNAPMRLSNRDAVCGGARAVSGTKPTCRAVAGCRVLRARRTRRGERSCRPGRLRMSR